MMIPNEKENVFTIEGFNAECLISAFLPKIPAVFGVVKTEPHLELSFPNPRGDLQTARPNATRIQVPLSTVARFLSG